MPHDRSDWMTLALRWVGTEELDRVALTRMRCYAHADKELDRFKARLQNDARDKTGDYLLAELNGEPVGTATSLTFPMWVRGASLPCQGVAWVGAIKTMRRRGANSASGIASTVMREMLRRARELEQPLSALTPFRTSFYEHFGYGIVERRHEWNIPMSVLPTGPFDNLRFYEPSDFDSRTAGMLQVNRSGQCDVERPEELWHSWAQALEEGFQIVDRPDKNSPIKSWMHLAQQTIDNQNTLVVGDRFATDAPAFRRQLHFLTTLRDQYSAVQLTLPADLPLNWLLKEPQLPHRPVNHPTVKYKPITRMQVRILDHARFLQALNLPITANGKTTVAVHECEGQISRFSIDITRGKATVQPSNATPEFECPDRLWAAVACGDIPATQALRWNLATGAPKAAALLDVLSDGPVPFCNEYF
jgi:predicted acetyltransferase